MSTRPKDHRNQEALAVVGAAPSAVWRIERLPSWREALAADPSSAAGARTALYAARHPGFAHLLHLVALDDEEEIRAADEYPCHTTGLRRIPI
jgi:hypothetical protein